MHPLKNDCFIDSNFDDISTFSKFVQPSKTLSPIFIAEEGILIDFKDVQLQNEKEPIEFTEDGIVTRESE